MLDVYYEVGKAGNSAQIMELQSVQLPDDGMLLMYAYTSASEKHIDVETV